MQRVISAPSSMGRRTLTAPLPSMLSSSNQATIVSNGYSHGYTGAWSSVLQVCWATKKTGGSTKNKQDSAGKRLGVKKFGGEQVKPGTILVRQRGTKYHPVWEGKTVGLGQDHTIYAKRDGQVKFIWNPKRRRTFLAVLPPGEDKEWLNQYVEADKRSPSWDTF
eukprot:gb/GECG01008401.1/.p1 GENE.gb/GECG01008401.1/~~gb/GECG01008401.1/.p1  ORF type:complete len:164 (+),score=12.32 gb/GECG01008401.1/:1-492(+)